MLLVPKEGFRWKHRRIISMCREISACREKALSSGTAVLRTSSAGPLSHQLPGTCEISSMEEPKMWAQRWPLPSAVPPDTVCKEAAWTVTAPCTIHHCSSCGFSLAVVCFPSMGNVTPFLKYRCSHCSAEVLLFHDSACSMYKSSREAALTLYVLNALIVPSCLSPHWCIWHFILACPPKSHRGRNQDNYFQY